MKNNYLSFSVAIALLVGILFFLPNNDVKKGKYIPRDNQSAISMSSNGAIEYLTRIRANQDTKSIDVKDVENAKTQLKGLESRKEGSAEWIFRGPDNVGGRTRALLVDMDNSNLMFAGGVSGGLWKSTTAGQYWEKVSYEGATAEDFANLAISSMCQAQNGDIYFGTGEGFYHLSGGGTGGILGAGIWKSTDNGQTFSKLASTWTESDTYTFSVVNELAADPTDPNLIYAATRRGLKVTTDGGTTWEKTTMPDITYDSKFTGDVAIAIDGSVIASVGNKCLVKKQGTSAFVLRSGKDEQEGGNLISASNIGRMEFAYSPEDPNYVFCLVASQSETLRNIYKSEDGGDTWFIVGRGGSSLFQPLGTQGIYDMCIAVNPVNKDQVFIGGLDLYVGNAATTGNLFAWNQISLWSIASFSPLFVHADLHKIVFDPKDPQTMFIGSDGGISRGLINKDNYEYQFRVLNKNYNVTQFYSVGINSRGDLLGGTQDNGSLIITGFGNTEKNGFAVGGGDGGQVAMSQINPSIAYHTIYYGGLWRNNDANYADWNTFYTSDLADLQGWTGGVWDSDVKSAAFVTPIAYWETDNDEFSNEMVAFIARKDYPTDTTVIFPSHNVNKAPISVTLDKVYKKGDTIFYHDPYSALFALGMKRNVWLTRKAANWNVTLAQKDWWRALKKGTLRYNFSTPETDEYVTQLEFSADGNHLFFSTSDENLYRLSNLNEARTYNEADYLFGKNITTELTKIGNAGNRTITGISADPNDVNNIIITLGNYGNNDYVYLSKKAADALSSSSLSNFTNITGGLPQAPAYCALFEIDEDANRVLVGTDMGVFVADGLFDQVDGTSPVEWTPHQKNVGPVPVFQMKQQTSKKWANSTYGIIYIGTHGLGFFEDRTYKSISDEMPNGDGVVSESLKINIYPNPVVSSAKVSIELKQPENVIFEVVNISGQVVYSYDAGQLHEGENTVDVDFSALNKGVYLMQINGQLTDGALRFVKK